MNNINRRRYILKFKTFIYLLFFLVLFILLLFLYFKKNYLFLISENLIQSFSENFQYQFSSFDISGLDRVETEYVEGKLKKYLKTSIFLLPLDQINDSIKENNWVKEIYLNTNYKDTLYIKVVEYKPIGIYLFNKKYFYFNKNGKIIDETDYIDFSKKSLLVFMGNSSNLKANSIINILRNNDFQKKYKIESLEFINKRRWDLNLQNDIKLMLSEDDPNKSIDNFILIQNKLSKTDMINIKTYDLRDLKKTILINVND